MKRIVSFIKKQRFVIIAAIYLCVTYYIGQMLHVNDSDVYYSLDANNNKSVSISEQNNAESSSIEQLNILFEGVKSTDDNPWGFNAGIIEDDILGKCALLTPNTGMCIEIPENNALSFDFRIHPWVKESSDGAGVLIRLIDEETIVKEDALFINSDSDWINANYSGNDEIKFNKISILCNNGTQGDDSADWVLIRLTDTYISSFGRSGYVCSATYFGNQWPVNFWNSELEFLDEDFEQIKRDGFNSIIIVIPWKEFQYNTYPIEYNEYSFSNLDKVMEAAKRNNLDVYARIGYSWDYYNDTKEDIFERYLDLFSNKIVHDAWLDYCKSLYSTLSKYDVFMGAFLTWEDFWGCQNICYDEDEQRRISYASSIGYTNWISDNYSLVQYNELFGCNCDSIDVIPVPQKKEPAMEAFYTFFDEFLNNILKDTQEVFPNISIEVRMDDDPVINRYGEMSGYSHSSTFYCESSDYTAAMYGIPMGFENIGEKVSADEALSHTKYILSGLLDSNGGKPVYVEQFLFMDNTPQFSYNAQIQEGDISKYLEGVSDILLDYTKGYGIWTYRDYKNNMVYNPQFALADKGWIVNGDCAVNRNEFTDSFECCLKEGASISQVIPNIRNHFPDDTYTLEFYITECEDAQMEISMGNTSKQISITQSGIYSVLLPKDETFDLTIHEMKGMIKIDNITLYSFTQKGHLYDSDNNELDYITDIRSLNSRLLE